MNRSTLILSALLLAGFALQARAQCPPEQIAKLIGDGTINDQFGWSVATKDDVTVVGAPTDNPHGDDSGSVYVFRRVGSQWVQEAKLIPSDGHEDSYFGWSVATDGSQVVVGAYADDTVSPLNGSLYVFRFDGSSWVQDAKLYSGRVGRQGLGYSVAICGDAIAAGAPYSRTTGSAFVFRRVGGVWAEEAELL